MESAQNQSACGATNLSSLKEAQEVAQLRQLCVAILASQEQDSWESRHARSGGEWKCLRTCSCGRASDSWRSS
eukprot:2697195-Amphidinium_carterae.1